MPPALQAIQNKKENRLISFYANSQIHQPEWKFCKCGYEAKHYMNTIIYNDTIIYTYSVSTNDRGWMNLIPHQIICSLYKMRYVDQIFQIYVQQTNWVSSSSARKNWFTLTFNSSAATITTEVVPSPTSLS